MVENEAIQVGDAKEVQPELTDSAGKNVMPHVPKLTQLGREWYGAKIDTKQAGDALDAELIKTLDKLAPKILKAFEESNLASYHVILQDGSDRMLFRKEFSARQQIGEKKCGKQGGGRPRRKKAK